MNDKVFCTTKVPFSKRLKKEITDHLIGIILFLIIWFANYDAFSLIHMLALFAFLVFGVVVSLREKLESIYKIEFIDKSIVISGDWMNKPFSKRIGLNNSDMEIRAGSRGPGQVYYFLRLSSETDVFDINKIENWDYYVLEDIFKTYKSIKSERIIWDDKFMLEDMMKKAK